MNKGRVVCFDMTGVDGWYQLIVLSELALNTPLEGLHIFDENGRDNRNCLLLPVKECGGRFNHYDDGEVNGPYTSPQEAVVAKYEHLPAKQIYHTWEE